MQIFDYLGSKSCQNSLKQGEVPLLSKKKSWAKFWATFSKNGRTFDQADWSHCFNQMKLFFTKNVLFFIFHFFHFFEIHFSSFSGLSTKLDNLRKVAPNRRFVERYDLGVSSNL